MTKGIAALVAATSVFTPSRAASVAVSESRDELRANAAQYTLLIRKAPYAISVLKGAREILGHGAGPGTRISTGGSVYRVGNVKTWRLSGDTLLLTLASESGGPAADLSLTMRPRYIEVSWRIAGAVRVATLEENFPLKIGGHWFGGNVTSSHHWPLETAESVLDPFLATSNQTTPVWFASSGAAIFAPTYDPIGFSINQARSGLFSVHVRDSNTFDYRIIAGQNIADAYRTFTELAGKPESVPPKEYFDQPVFNTWIEYSTKISQAAMEDYARKIRDFGFPCKILMLDDGWLARYGDNRFDPAKFPDPKKMLDRIHRLGFKFVLWQVPFVEKVSTNFEALRRDGLLVLAESGNAPAMIKWWNGEAAMVDLSNPAAYRWYLGELQSLQRDFGVDGFKLDAGDAEYFDPRFVTAGKITPNRYTDLWAGMGRYFEINELRVSWLAQPWGLVQRLRDKSSDWSIDTGLGSIVRHALTESLIGYPYVCPDIIGGGLDSSFLEKGYRMDEELFVRWTEASALMPMMQFSYAPWRLSAGSVEIVKRYAALHTELGDYIYSLALRAKQDGTPIIRPLFLRNPEDEAAFTAQDEFLLGDRFLVAPVLTKGSVSRNVYLPAGTWKDFWSGKIFSGPRTLADYPAPLEMLPVFVSIE
jgi:alpha-glucosidase (family GH31 glycosyl hydrolase)